MNKYELIGVIQRNVVETFTIEISADNPEEAQDVVYEVLSDYPNSEFRLDRMLKIREESSTPFSIAIEFQTEELADPELEKVFEDDDDEPA